MAIVRSQPFVFPVGLGKGLEILNHRLVSQAELDDCPFYCIFV